MSMDEKGRAKQIHIIPARATEPMPFEISYEKCSSRFAVTGSTYFCPECGNNSVLQTFSDSLKKIKAKKVSIQIVREAIEEASGNDDAVITCRSIIESFLQDCDVAFQKNCDGMYEQFRKQPLNTFQRLEQRS